MKGQNLKALYESLGPVQCVALLDENLRSGEFKPADFSLRELAEAFCGRDWVHRLHEGNMARYSVAVEEAGDGVDVSAFSHITGQLLFSKILEGWEQPGLIGEQLVETIDSKLDGEKFPWLGRIPQEGEAINPGKPYPEVGFGERYLETPSTTKKGMIVSITKEAVFFDRTAQILMRAAEIGERLRMGKEKDIHQVFLGVINTYKFMSNTYNTYQVASDVTSTTQLNNWVNKIVSTPLVDWTSVEKLELLAAEVLDPDTQNPILLDLDTMVVMPAKLHTAKRIVSATDIETIYPGYSASSPSVPGNVKMSTTNPLKNYNVITSNVLYQSAKAIDSTNAKDWWFLFDSKRKPFAWIRNWDITVVNSPNQSTAEFERDIVSRYKASHRGVPAVWDPRRIFFGKNA